MQLGAMKEETVDLLLGVEPALAWDGAGAVALPAWSEDPPAWRRGEVAALVALSVVVHAVVAVQLSRASRAEPLPRLQQVEIEVLPPPLPPVVPPQEPERPVARRLARPEPRVVPRLEPLATPATPPPAAELPALPEGDDPALALPSGKGAPAAPAPLPIVAPAPPAPPPVVEAHEGANYLSNPRPAYPEVAQRRGWEGEVVLRVRVGPDGRPAAITVHRPSGRDVLDDAAVEAVRGWTFVPARQAGQPVAGWVNVPIVFHLQ